MKTLAENIKDTKSKLNKIFEDDDKTIDLNNIERIKKVLNNSGLKWYEHAKYGSTGSQTGDTKWWSAVIQSKVQAHSVYARDTGSNTFVFTLEYYHSHPDSIGQKNVPCLSFQRDGVQDYERTYWLGSPYPRRRIRKTY
jgi:hypothetical protein